MAAVARFFFFVLLIMPATAGDARAQPNVVQQVTEWGLLGTWSSDCSRTPSDARYLVRDGKVLQYWWDDKDAASLVTAQVGSNGTLLFRAKYSADPKDYVDVSFEKQAGKIRFVFQRDADGSYFVRQGKFVSDGVALPWFVRCR